MALPYSEFKTAITQLEYAWQRCEDTSAWQRCEDTSTWQDLSIKTSHYEPQVSFLRITRRLSVTPAPCTTTENEEQRDISQGEDSDEEALSMPTVSASASGSLVTYDIVHHPTYNCPALFIDLTAPDGTRYGAADMYELLVSAAYKQPLKSVGVMGSLSQADHPISNKPAFMVHPCRTQEAMNGVLAVRHGGSRSHSEIDYLLAWFGVICGSVGLEVPVSLATSLSRLWACEVQNAEA